MKHLKYFLLYTSLVIAVSSFNSLVVKAQLPDNAYPVIVTPHKQTVSFRERTLCYEITANVDFTVTANAEWVSVRKADDGTVYVHLQQNSSSEARTANIVFANAENSLSETLVITQGRNESIEDITPDTEINAKSVTANNSQSGNGADLTRDGNTSTYWHTNWSNYFEVSEENPATLTYTFTNVSHIDYAKYITRQDGVVNGNFKHVQIYAMCDNETSYSLITDVTLDGSAGTYRIDLGKNGLDNPKSIQFKVLSGNSDQDGMSFASCAEMEFYVDNSKGLLSIFNDDALTSLKEGTTQADIDNIDDDFVSSFAQQLFDGNYDTAYRVGQYTAKLEPSVQSDLWNAPGKLYDQRQGVTGINIPKGKQAIAVSGLADGQTVQLAVTAWYVGKVGSNFDGGNPTTESFSLRNGLNVIDYTGDYDGLAYVCYYADANPELQPTITVHFINGQVNGYLSLDKTNEEMHEMLANAPNVCMDVVGNKAHTVWTINGIDGEYSNGLYGACLATDGTSLGYRQFMHVLDSLVTWEHNLLGFEKYNRLPDNRTMAYVNFTYYMFQGSFGVSFHVDQENRVLNCKTLVYNDNDAIWGLSHEWGHQHQMQPYFCWGGMGEVTNNMNSYYNIMRMGYRSSDKIDNFTGAIKHFITQNYNDITLNSPITENSGSTLSYRGRAYRAASELSFSKNMYNLALAMKDSTIVLPSVDATKALSINEVGVGETLCPFIKLYVYFTTHGFPDFAPDWYEALRQNDDENGSQVEKQGEVDKYELIASAQNNNKNSKYEVLKEKYPNSVWVKNNYVTASSTRWQNSMPYILNFIRKTSRLSGYNLIPFFERWGFLRQIALNIGDYGNKWTVLTSDMYDEFVEDMEALGLKTMNDDLVEEISKADEMYQTRPTFPN